MLACFFPCFAPSTQLAGCLTNMNADFTHPYPHIFRYFHNMAEYIQQTVFFLFQFSYHNLVMTYYLILGQYQANQILQNNTCQNLHRCGANFVLVAPGPLTYADFEHKLKPMRVNIVDLLQSVSRIYPQGYSCQLTIQRQVLLWIP